MQPKRCRWWQGEIEEEEGEAGRMLSQSVIPPLMLEPQNEIVLIIRDRKVDG